MPAPRTILAGVRKLPPATILTVERDGTRAQRTYWDPPFERAHPDWSAEDWQDALLEALRVAVRRRMVADVPVGVLLSGGLDSSLIVALLAEEGQRGLATFSIGFPDAGGREGDEFEYSDAVAAHVRDRPPPDPRRHGRARRRAPAGDRGDGRADGLARLRRVLAAVAGGAARPQGRPVGPGRGRGARRLQLVPAAAGRPGQRARHLRGGVLRPRRRGRARARWRPRRCRATTSRTRSRTAGSRAPGRPRRSTARCGSTPR